MTSTAFQDRRRRLAALLHEKKLDGYLFGGISDLYYLTGFHSEGFFGLVTAKGSWIFCSALLAQQIRENTSGLKLVVGQRLTVALQEIAKKNRLKRIGFDADQTMFRLGQALSKTGLAAAPNPLEELRIVKSKEELSLLAKACRITASAVQWLIPRVKAGMTEIGMARMLRDRFEALGSNDVAFELISAVGPHTALPHHRPTEAVLKKDKPVLFDVGCKAGVYRSDLTRTFFYGRIPADFRRVYGIVDAAQKAGIQAVKPGRLGGDVDGATRDVIKKSGYADYFVHSTGHGVGVDIHEPPWIREKSPDLLKPDMVLTVEPGIYLPGRFGVRIEDTLRVTTQGHEILTKA
jgi:Xaa-Pro aminopeptidase